jgi:acetate kinase
VARSASPGSEPAATRLAARHGVRVSASAHSGGSLRAIRHRGAKLALDVYVHRLRAGIAAMAAALGGLNTLVITGGVGVQSAPVRAVAAAGLGFLGIVLDPERNAAARGDAYIGAAGAAVQNLVVEAREDLEIARQVRAVLTVGRGAPPASAFEAR